MSEHPLTTRTCIRAGVGSLLGLLLLLLAPRPTFAAEGREAAPATDIPPLRLVVNIPARRLDVYEGGQRWATFPVTVGKPTEPTPDGHFQLRRVVWNPWWRPPYNRKPKDKDTPPRPRNPMGKVKLYFTDEYYLHGTARSWEIGAPASRGCVRLRNPDAIALAMLVHRYAAPLPEATLQSLAGTRSWVTHEYRLQRSVPLDIHYDLAEVRDGELMVYPDLYHHRREPLDQLATRALEAAGYSAGQIDRRALGRALARGSGAVAVSDLVRQSRAATDEGAAGAASSSQRR